MDGKGISQFTQVAHIWNLNNLPLTTNNDPISVHFTDREWHFYCFDLAAGDRVYFTPLSTPPALLQHSFTGPGGVTPNVSFALNTPSAFTVTRPGRYTLVLLHPSSDPADFTFQIQALPLREFYGAPRK